MSLPARSSSSAELAKAGTTCSTHIDTGNFAKLLTTYMYMYIYREEKRRERRRGKDRGRREESEGGGGGGMMV